MPGKKKSKRGQHLPKQNVERAINVLNEEDEENHRPLCHRP